MAQTASKRRGHGEDSIYWDAARNRYLGTIDLGFGPLPLDRDLIFVLMPDHKGRDVVAFSDGLQGTVIGFA